MAPDPQQMSFLPLLDKPTENVSAIVIEERPGVFLATICGGWWIGVSDTAKTAIKKAVENYEREVYACQ